MGEERTGEIAVSCPNCLNTVYLEGGEYGVAFGVCERCEEQVQARAVIRDNRVMIIVENVSYTGVRYGK